MLVFFFCIRRPPRSTLFPYRRSSDLGVQGSRSNAQRKSSRSAPGSLRGRTSSERRTHARLERSARSLALRSRSEEHTSELQSRRDIVCRLLLEKKKISLRLFRDA